MLFFPRCTARRRKPASLQSAKGVKKGLESQTRPAGSCKGEAAWLTALLRGGRTRPASGRDTHSRVENEVRGTEMLQEVGDTKGTK